MSTLVPPGAQPSRRAPQQVRPRTPDFAEGGDDPYRSRLHGPRSAQLSLHRTSAPAPATAPVPAPSPAPAGAGPQGVATGTSWHLDVLRAPADSADLAAIAGVAGPLLDVGCGPGRMVGAAVDQGLDALGVDVADEAADACAQRGARAVRGSVFDAVPDEGGWATVLLMDGNLGIGGDPEHLFARCAALLAPGGVLVVEADADEHAEEHGWYVVVDDGGAASAPFPWARLGLRALLASLGRSGFSPAEVRRAGGRSFVHASRGR